MPENTLSVTVVVGNPKAPSRTSTVGTRLAELISSRLATSEPTITTVELSALTAGLFAWGDAAVAAAKAQVLAADLLIVVSPVYKASFTGLLKAFLDQFGADELAAKPTVPAMVGAAADHRLAVDLQLRPVLIEIGASCPTRGVYVLDSAIDALPTTFDGWWAVWGQALAAPLRDTFSA
jgi:FMN reductase